MAQKVDGKSAIVTGAGSGIGLEFCRLLLDAGANVLFADVALRPEAQELIDRHQQTPNKAVYHKTDVSSWSDLEEMFRTAEASFGGVDIVCPGAGIYDPVWSNFWHPPGTAESRDDPQGGSYKLLDINLVHPIRTSQLALSHFLDAPVPCSPSNPKTIVFIASVAAQLAMLPFPLYAVSKHGVQAFVRSLGDLEESHGVRVTAVDPGVVKTPIWLEAPDKLRLLKQDGDDPDDWVAPEKVAQVMLACVQDDDICSGVPGEDPIPIRGGTCLEILTDTARDVPLYNNVGPFALGRRGAKAGNFGQAKADVLAMLKPGWGK